MTKNSKKIYSLIAVIIAAIAIVAWCVYDINSQTKASEITMEEAEQIINKELDEIAVSKVLKHVAKENHITVNDLFYGEQKNVILDCTVKTLDVQGCVKPAYNDFLSADPKKKNGTMFKSTLDFKMEFENQILKLLEEAKTKEENIEIVIYDTQSGFKVHTDDSTLNSVFGGISYIKDEVMKIEAVQVGSETKKIASTNVNKGLVQCFEARATNVKPETARGLVKIWNSIKEDFDVNFLRYNRWKTIFQGLWVTIKLTIFSLLIGVVLGFIVAFIRCTYLKTSKHPFFLKILNGICQVYLTVIRGTPVVVQIMIIYFVIFMPLGVDKFLSAVVCFGLNSGAYVAEIVRGGIMNLDDGQTEAGRSLGFNYFQTMGYIVLPQAFKAVLPALANEFVVLLKETSVAFYIGLGDLMYAGNAIRSATYSPFMPLVAVAIIYFAMVLGLSKLVSILERRLRTSER